MTKELASVSITPEFVMSGSRTPYQLKSGEPLNSQLVESIQQALKRGRKGTPGLALSVDEAAPFEFARRVIALSLRESLNAFELRLSHGDEVRAFRVCAFAENRSSWTVANDCWGRPRPTPPAAAGDADTHAVGDGASRGDVESSGPGFDWSSPLELSLSIESDYVLIRVQGRTLRTLAINEGETPGHDRLRDVLRQTLIPLRQRNDWDRRVTIRVANEIMWRDVVRIIDSLTSQRFDAVAFNFIEDGL